MQDQTKVRVAAVQMEPKLGRIEANLERILGSITETAQAGAVWSCSPNAPFRATDSLRVKRASLTPSTLTVRRSVV